MDAARFDALARSLTETRSRRGTLRGLLLGTGSLLSLSAAEDAAARNCRKIKNRKKRKACLANAATCASPCGKGCCSADACFAEAVDASTVQPLGFACCPADKLCRSPKPSRKDQCCYPDETCDPTLADVAEAETICCRPCGGGCCLQLNEECNQETGQCEPVDTARLARTRRPG